MAYKRYSKSAQTLRYAFGARLRPVKPELTPKGTELVLNWGCSKPKPTARCRFLNKPENVHLAVNKLRAFTKLKEAEVAVPEFTTDASVASGWLADGRKVIGRKLLESHSGNGITIFKEGDTIPAGFPLYVRYFRKKHEFRVHVFAGQVIDYVEKKAREGSTNSATFNKYIRSYNHGWVFCRDGVALPEKVQAEAIKAVAALGLDFGAVDIGMSERGKVAVFEVNCAPALEGTTVEKYKAALASYVR